MQPEEDILEQMRQVWQEQARHSEQMPGLSDEMLEEVFANCEREREKMPPLSGGGVRLTWAQALAAAVCLSAAVCGAAVCARMWDDVPLRILLCAVAGVSLLFAVRSVAPRLSFLYRCRCRESLDTIAADGSLPAAGYVLRGALYAGVTSFAILVMVTSLPIGDGYHIAMVASDRLGAVEDITYLITHAA